MIDEHVLKVVGIRGDSVRLGFDFPKEVRIHRREVYDEIKTGEEIDAYRK
jgi:carbon storage regulator CsrA